MVGQQKPEVKGMKNTKREKDRKPYIKPQLNKYGHMEKLTEGAAGSGIEPGRTRKQG